MAINQVSIDGFIKEISYEPTTKGQRRARIKLSNYDNKKSRVFTVSAWDNTADYCEHTLKLAEGDYILVFGAVSSRFYPGSRGTSYFFEINAKSILKLDNASKDAPAADAELPDVPEEE